MQRPPPLSPPSPPPLPPHPHHRRHHHSRGLQALCLLRFRTRLRVRSTASRGAINGQLRSTSASAASAAVTRRAHLPRKMLQTRMSPLPQLRTPRRRHPSRKHRASGRRSTRCSRSYLHSSRPMLLRKPPEPPTLPLPPRCQLKARRSCQTRARSGATSSRSACRARFAMPTHAHIRQLRRMDEPNASLLVDRPSIWCD